MSEIIIRRATVDDAEKILQIYSYYVENTAITFEYVTPTIDEFRGRIVDTTKKYPYLVAEKDSEIVGYAYAGAFVGRAAYDWSASLTIYIEKNLRGQGIGGRLYKALRDELVAMGITNLYSCVACPDVDDEYLTRNSMNFHEHLGFKIAGRFTKCGYKFGRWYNMVWMEKIIAEHVPNIASVKFYDRE